MISLDLIGTQLQSIQAELREMKFAADVDRRNARSHYDNLVTEVGVKIGLIEAKLDMMLGRVEHQLERIESKLDGLFEQKADAVPGNFAGDFERDPASWRRVG